MTVIEQYAKLSTSLVRRFEVVRAGHSVEDIAKEIGIGHITIYAWLAQDRTTRIEILAKIERWVEGREATQQPVTQG